MDINAPDFVETFKKEDAIVGIVGQGFVGGAMKAYFDKHQFKVVAYDKFRPEFGTLEDVVKQAHVIFVCVPTPMRSQTGECFTGIPESVFDDIDRTAREIGRPQDTFVCCLKSTVPPGFTDKMRAKYPNMRITFSPEFLTEKNAIRDMLTATRVVVGGDLDDARVVLHFFLNADRRRVDEGKCVLVQTEAAVAEMAKLFGNGLLFSRVLFANEIFQLCKKMGIEYEDVRVVTALDQRIGGSHLAVPGPDGFLGAGGHCFPKDMSNLKFLAEQLGTGEKMFSAILDRNAEVREEKDWEKMNDRAVTDQ
jgi:UDPglucose 6-dehydrogenase